MRMNKDINENGYIIIYIKALGFLFSSRIHLNNLLCHNTMRVGRIDKFWRGCGPEYFFGGVQDSYCGP